MSNAPHLLRQHSQRHLSGLSYPLVRVGDGIVMDGGLVAQGGADRHVNERCQVSRAIQLQGEGQTKNAGASTA